MIDSKPAARQKFGALTSLRFVAAFCIVAMHLGGHFGLPADMTFKGRMPLHQGVSFFFVLSGFIMTYVYPTVNSWPERRRFLVARFARVWPVHLFATLFSVVVAVRYAKQLIEIPPLIANLFMIHAWIPMEKCFFSGNLVSWSVSTEWGFYLLFLVLILKIERTWPIKALICLFAAFSVIGLCVAFALPYSRPVGVTSNGLLYMNPIARLFEFSCGMGAACAWRRYGAGANLSVKRATVFELLASFLVVICAYYSIPWANALSKAIGVSVHFALWFSCGGFSAIPFALLIFVLALQRGVLSKVLASRWIVALGEISFSIYLLHFTLLGVFYFHFFGSALPNSVLLLTYIGSLFALSALVWWLIENPCRRWIVLHYGKSRWGTHVP